MDAPGLFPYQYNRDDQSVPTTWHGPTLVVKGEKHVSRSFIFFGKDGSANGVGRYINHKNAPALHTNMQLEALDTGHWGKYAHNIITNFEF